MTALKKILWADAIAGGSTGIAGLALSGILTGFLGLPQTLILIIAAVTFAYAILAFYLARAKQPQITLLRILVYANWAWTVISVGLLSIYLGNATTFGAIFLILQIMVVGLLAWLEGRHL